MKKNALKGKFKLTADQERRIKEEIRAFYLDVRDEEIGIIEEQQILDLFYEHMAPVIYNKALDDAFLWHRQQMENLQSDYYLLYQEMERR